MPEPTDLAVRFADKDEWIIEGLIVPFFGPVAGNKDLLGTRFDQTTDLCLDWFPDGGRPGLYSHGFDKETGTSVIGREIRSTRTAKGIWLQAQLDKAHEYAAEIRQLVDEGVLALSSGAVDHLVSIDAKSRAVRRWPWVEWSLVPNPGNPEALIYNVRSTDALIHLRDAGADERVFAVRFAEAPEEDEEPAPAKPMTLQMIHDMARDLGAQCAPMAAERSAEEREPVPVLAVQASPVPLSDADLAQVRSVLTETAIARAKEILHLT